MPVIELPEKAKKILLRILSLVMLLEMLDATVLNTALPQIAVSLHVNPIQLKEILTIYFLSLGIFIPVSGWAADRFGEKNAMMFAILLFTLSSIGCGVATNLSTLIVFRFLQGIGGAFLMPVGRQITIRVFSGIERIQAMAKVNTMTLLGVSLGPLIGGILTTYANWRWIFFLNVPGGLLALYMIYHHLPVIREREKIKFDLIGFCLIGIFLGSFLFLLDIAVDPSINLSSKSILLITAVVSFFIYIYYAKSVSEPLIRLTLFKQDDFKFASIGSFLSRLTLSTQPFLVPLLIQAGYGYSAMISGLLTMPTILSNLLCMFFLAHLVKRFASKNFLIINTVLLLIIYSSFYLQAIQFMIPLLILQQFLIGFILPIQTALMNSKAYEGLSGVYVSQGTSVYSGIIQVSGSFGIALAALVMISVIGPNDLQHQVPLIAFKVVFLVQSIYLFLALGVFIYQSKSLKNSS